MSIFSKAEHEVLAKNGGVAHMEDGYTPEEIDRAVALLKEIAEGKVPGLFLVLQKSDTPDGHTAMSGMAKVNGVSRFEAIETIFAALKFDRERIKRLLKVYTMSDD